MRRRRRRKAKVDLIEHEDARFAQQSAGEAEQLALADGEVGATLGDGLLELAGERGDEVLQARDAQRLPDLVVRVLVERVDVVAQRADEQLRLLEKNLRGFKEERRGPAG